MVSSINSDKKGKYSYDLHGVIDTYPEIFKKDMACRVINGAEVFVLSGPPEDQIYKEITELGLLKNTHYHKILSVVDYILRMGYPMWKNNDGSWQTTEEIWWGIKAVICYLFGINEHIDNDIKYMYSFINTHHDTKFKLIVGA